MPAPRVHGHYDQLGKIASTFGAQAENSHRTLQQVKSQMDTLRGGDGQWNLGADGGAGAAKTGGDGWGCRSRGAIQIIGRDNYEAAGTALELDLVNHPELLEQPENALRASAWWWQNHGLNERVDANPNDVEGVTRVINGGTHELEVRQNRFDRIRAPAQ